MRIGGALCGSLLPHRKGTQTLMRVSGLTGRLDRGDHHGPQSLITMYEGLSSDEHDRVWLRQAFGRIKRLYEGTSDVLAAHGWQLQLSEGTIEGFLFFSTIGCLCVSTMLTTY